MSHLIIPASEVRSGDVTDIFGAIDLKVINSGPADHLLLGVSSRDLATLQRITLLGVGVFWLYYQVYIVGTESILPASWHNPPGT